ncbi:MAG: hypothetical protein J2P18_18170 [Nocardia sp.]|nr:hypothetical protein [Nocardia sp.]
MVQDYSEATENPSIAAIPLSHLSIEVGHFTLKEIAEDPAKVRAEMRRIVPLVAAFEESARRQYGPHARISSCYLIDDYFQGEHPDRSPARIVPRLLTAARECGLRIDYLARESACAQAELFSGGVAVGEPIEVAEMVAARIVPEPAPHEGGARPPTSESGWLCNGRRSSSAEPAQAMRERVYRPPVVFSSGEHSIFIDIELWSVLPDTGRRRWSCPFLAAIWHLLRLGMLRYHGAAVVDPQPWSGDAPWPERWHELPPVIALEPGCQAFAAYQTLSMLPKRYIEVEHAVKVILDHLDLDEEIGAQIAASGAAEGIAVAAKVSERQAHLLLDES